ncbi:Uncharacterised protein [Mycobacteroides abscessus subsp. abscessus]|nr:Uncharacterised protein [Mycobacteroides abscessus subsp. abscessus]
MVVTAKIPTRRHMGPMLTRVQISVKTISAINAEALTRCCVDDAGTSWATTSATR